MRPSVRILIPHFGTWPDWIDLFFETARRNPTIDFLVITDCHAGQYVAPNIEVRPTSFDHYVDSVRTALGLPFNPRDGYKLCDLRPLFGMLHEQDFAGYDFYGWCDTDILFGDIRRVYTDDVFARYDVLSTHANRISGHFALFRNTKRNRTMYRDIYDWRRFLLEPDFVGLDEHGITNAYLMTTFHKLAEKFGWRLDNAVTRFCASRRRARIYLVEEYTTPFVPFVWLDGSLNSAQPDLWFYQDGRVTNSRDDRDFIYLHFMNFKSSRWRHDGTPAPWESVSCICRASADDMQTGITIDKTGIHRCI